MYAYIILITYALAIDFNIKFKVKLIGKYPNLKINYLMDYFNLKYFKNASMNKKSFHLSIRYQIGSIYIEYIKPALHVFI